MKLRTLGESGMEPCAKLQRKEILTIISAIAFSVHCGLILCRTFPASGLDAKSRQRQPERADENLHKHPTKLIG